MTELNNESVKTSVEPTKITTYVTGGEPRFVKDTILKSIEENYNVNFDILGWCGKTDNPSGDMPVVELVLHIKSMASHAHRLFAKKWSEKHNCLLIETGTKFAQSKELYDKLLVPYLKNKNQDNTKETKETKVLPNGDDDMVTFSEKAVALESDMLNGNKIYSLLPYVKGEEDRLATWAKNVVAHTGYTREDFESLLEMWRKVGSMQGQTNKAYLLDRRNALKEAKKQWLIDYVVAHDSKSMREVDLIHREVFGNVLSRTMQEFLNEEWFHTKPSVKEEAVSKPEPVVAVVVEQRKLEPVVVAPKVVEQAVVVAPKVVEQPVKVVVEQPVQPQVILTMPKPIVVGMPNDHEVLFDNDVFVVNPKFGQVTLARVEAQVVLVGRKVVLEYDEGSQQGVLLNVKLKGL